MLVYSIAVPSGENKVEAETIVESIPDYKPTTTPINVNKTIKPSASVNPVTKTKEYKLLQIGIIEDNFAGVANVRYDEDLNMVNVTPIDDTFMIELALAQEGSKKHIKSWNSLVDNFVEISKNLDGTVLTVTNNLNIDNDILVIMDGVILYNVLN
jgi:hypothetical protein